MLPPLVSPLPSRRPICLPQVPACLRKSPWGSEVISLLSLIANLGLVPCIPVSRSWPLVARVSAITRGPDPHLWARKTLSVILFMMVVVVISREVCRLSDGISSRSLAWRVLT